MTTKSLQQLAEEIIAMLESGEMEQFRSYTYYHSYFMQGTWVASRTEVCHYPFLQGVGR